MADTKVTGLTENTTVATTDMLYLVDDPGGTPASEKATVANVVLAGMVDIGAHVYNSGALSVVTATWTAMPADSEYYDTDTIHSTVSNTSRLTATTAGKYWIWANVGFAANSTGDRAASFDLNGGDVFWGIQRVGAFASSNCNLTPGVELDLAASDYVECRCRHSKGSNLDVTLLGFGMRRVG